MTQILPHFYQTPSNTQLPQTICKGKYTKSTANIKKFDSQNGQNYLVNPFSQGLTQLLQAQNQKSKLYTSGSNLEGVSLYYQIHQMEQRQKQLQRINNILVSTLRQTKLKHTQDWKLKYQDVLKDKLQLQMVKLSLLKQISSLKQTFQNQKNGKESKNQQLQVILKSASHHYQDKQYKKPQNINLMGIKSRNNALFFNSILKMDEFMAKVTSKSQTSKKCSNNKYHKCLVSSYKTNKNVGSRQKSTLRKIKYGLPHMNSTKATINISNVSRTNNKKVKISSKNNKSDKVFVLSSDDFGQNRKLQNFKKIQNSISKIQQQKLSFN